MIPPIYHALSWFAAAVTEKTSQVTSGGPEDQLRAPFESFVVSVASGLGWELVCTGEPPLPNRLGTPDYAVHLNGLLSGYVELKAPGVGANYIRFKDRNRQQFKRFSAIPNIVYTDGNEWALYRFGERVRPIVRLSGDVASEGSSACSFEDAQRIDHLLRDFFLWQPIIPMAQNGAIDLKRFAEQLAPLCRMLRDDVMDALKDEHSPLLQLATDWRHLLFPDASNEQFADAYAQTATFALLLGRSEGADPLTLDTATNTLDAQHNLLSRALQILTERRARHEISASLDLLLRVISVVPPASIKSAHDPWLYFYEDFLASYDPELRKNAGVYYTPVEVVHAQTRMIDDLLVHRLSKPLGFADSGVFTLDPAVGTGTYLLGIIEHALERVATEQGEGAVPSQATVLARNLHGFELLVGAYAVTDLRVSRALLDRGASLPPGGTHVYLTDTLESPTAEAPELPLFLRPIAQQHERALKVKADVPVMICVGNPPYDRHEAASRHNRARTGGWVRWGEDANGTNSIFSDFVVPAHAAGYGIHIKNLYNLYVYFWRWALWKVFEQEDSNGPGVVSFITAASYLDGHAFAGMREHMRRVCDEIWILDLGGEGRGTRRDDNVFAIQTPVAIAVALRTGVSGQHCPATVRYSRIEGKRSQKLATLDSVHRLSDIEWCDCSHEWLAPFRPQAQGQYVRFPLLTDLMPWQQSGVKAGRTWVICPDEDTLKNRWDALTRASHDEREKLFKNSPTGRKVHEAAIQLPPYRSTVTAVADLPMGSNSPQIVRYAFRTLDRQFIFSDARLIDRPCPTLWSVHSDRQVYLTTLLNHPLGAGPAMTACAYVPDLHHFRGSYGAKEVVPLYRTADSSAPNVLPGLLDCVGERLKQRVQPEDMVSYIYGLLANPAFTGRFSNELETRELRVPITKNPMLFEQVRAVGSKLLWLHTYGERFLVEGQPRGRIPPGRAKCIVAVPGTPDEYPESFTLLQRVLESECFQEDELPATPAGMRKPPRVSSDTTTLL